MNEIRRVFLRTDRGRHPRAALLLSDPGDSEFFERHRAVGTDLQAGRCAIASTVGAAWVVRYDVVANPDGVAAPRHRTGAVTVVRFRDLPDADQRAFVIAAFASGEALMDEVLTDLHARCVSAEGHIYCSPAG